MYYSLSLRTTLLSAFLALFSISSHAAGVVLEMGLHTGGDDLVTATFVGGDTETLEAGGLYHFAIGAGFDINEKWNSRVTFGIKEDSINAENGDLKFTRYPIDAVFLYNVNKWMLGGGLTYHTNVELSGSGVVSGFNAEFDDALGFLLEADYHFGQPGTGKGGYIGARYTVIDYDISGPGGSASIDGNSIGVVLGIRF